MTTSDLTVTQDGVPRWGELVLQTLAELSGKERSGEVIPNLKSDVICCLASDVLLLRICVAPVKEVEKVTQGHSGI